ncbi:MAG: signal peptidase II [Azoarcus sp.]|jgi:signal peptidase II|nr:signal peptidase II [Azoarcus sp.]
MTLWLVSIGVVIVLDQVTKEWALAQPQLARGGRIEVTFFFDLILAFNRGAAFSFLAEHSGWQSWFFAVLALAVSAWLLVLTWQHRLERLLPCAFTLIIGGALGNVIDRFNHGAVVDFLSFHAGSYYWPAFNLADSAITLGVGLMFIAHFRTKRNTESSPENPI